MNQSRTLFWYAAGLLSIGLACIFYNPETSVFGFNIHGISGFIADGSGALLAAIFGFFASRNKPWAHWAGAILCFMMLIMGFQRGFLAARAINPGHAHDADWFKVATLGATAFISLAALMPLLMYIRHHRGTPVETEP